MRLPTQFIACHAKQQQRQQHRQQHCIKHIETECLTGKRTDWILINCTSRYQHIVFYINKICVITLSLDLHHVTFPVVVDVVVFAAVAVIAVLMIAVAANP